MRYVVLTMTLVSCTTENQYTVPAPALDAGRQDGALRCGSSPSGTHTLCDLPLPIQAADAGAEAIKDTSIPILRAAPKRMSLARGQAIWDEGHANDDRGRTVGNPDCAARQYGLENPGDVLAYLLRRDAMLRGTIYPGAYPEPSGSPRVPLYGFVMHIIERQEHDQGQDPAAFVPFAIQFVQISIEATTDDEELSFLDSAAIDVLETLYEDAPAETEAVLHAFMASGKPSLYQDTANLLSEHGKLTQDELETLLAADGYAPDDVDPVLPEELEKSIAEEMRDAGVQGSPIPGLEDWEPLPVDQTSTQTGGYACILPFSEDA